MPEITFPGSEMAVGRLLHVSSTSQDPDSGTLAAFSKATINSKARGLEDPHTIHRASLPASFRRVTPVIVSW